MIYASTSWWHNLYKYNTFNWKNSSDQLSCNAYFHDLSYCYISFVFHSVSLNYWAFNSLYCMKYCVVLTFSATYVISILHFIEWMVYLLVLSINDHCIYLSCPVFTSVHFVSLNLLISFVIIVSFSCFILVFHSCSILTLFHCILYVTFVSFLFRY